MTLRAKTFVLTAASVAAALAGVPARAQDASPAAGEAQPALRFNIDAFDVAGNTLLPPAAVEEAVYPYAGPDKTPQDVEAARAALQAAFESRGYSTVAVFVPEQQVDSGVIRLEVQPQTIGKVEVVGNTRTSREDILARAPSLQPGVAPNFDALQKDIVALNQTADRRVTPEIKAGEAPGTLDVKLAVEETSPFHGSVEVNNYGSAQTSDLRVAGSLRYDDLWGLGHSASISAQFAPERTGDGAVVSANYLARVGRVQVLAYGLISESDIAVLEGLNVVGSGFVGGGRVIVPLTSSQGFYSALTVGADYKDFAENLLLGADRDSAPITYVPLSVAWRGDWQTETLKQDVTLTATYGLRGIGSDAAEFDNKRFGARPNFFHLRADASHRQDFGPDLQAYFHLAGSWSPDPLISNEQFSIGGNDSVRGYFESEGLADYGVFYQTELRSPPFGALVGGEPDDLRFHVFFDSGVGAIHRPLPSQDRRFGLVSAGAGARVKLFDILNGAFDLGVPVLDGPNTDAGSLFARFRIWGEF